MSTHKVVVDLIAKASGNGFKDAAKDAGDLERKVQGSGAVTTGVMAKIGSSGKAMGLAVAAGALAGGVALAKFASNSVNAFISTTDAVRGFQRVAGGTAEDASKLTFALKRVGIAPETAAKGFGMLSAKIGQGKVDLAQYGVHVKKNKDGSVDMADAVLQLSDSLGKMNTNARNAAIKDLFGKGGQTILPLLTKSREELKAIFDLAGKDHQIFSQEDIDQARDYKAALAEMDLAWQGMEVQIGQAVLPLLQTLTEDVFTPLAQLVADNADAFKTMGIVVASVAVPALLALTAVKVGSVLSEGYAAIGVFVRSLGLVGPAASVAATELGAVAVAEDAVATSSIAAGAAVRGGLLASLTGLVTTAGTVATALAAIDPSGILISQVAPNPKSNAEKADEARAAAQRKFVQEGIAGTRDVGAAYDWLNHQIDKTRGVIKSTTTELNKRPRASMISRLFGADDNGVSKLQDQLWSAKDRLDALKAAVRAYGGEAISAGDGTGRMQSAVSVLSTAIQEGAQESDTFTGAQENLKQALIDAAGATNSDKDAKKQLEDAINRVTAASDRMNNAIYTTIDASLATKGAQDALNEALLNGADASTITANANAVAKAKVNELDTALQAAGNAPLTTAQKNEVYLQTLKDLAAQSPATAAALNPYIAQLQAAVDKTKTVNDNPVRPKVDTSEADAKLAALNATLQRIVGTVWTVYLRGVTGAFGGGSGGKGKTDGEGANGGYVPPNSSWLVGERGPEIIRTGSQSAWITPNHKLGSMGGGTVNHYTINVNSLVPTAATGQLIREHLHKAERAGVTTSSVAG